MLRQRIGLAFVVMSLVAMTAATGTLVTRDEAVAAAGSWLAMVDGGDERSVLTTEVIWRDGLVVAYVLHLAPEGWVVVPAVKELPPVKAFSLYHSFTSEADSIGGLVIGELASIREELPGRLALEQQAGGKLGQDNHKRWQMLLDDSAAARKQRATIKDQTVTVGPFVEAIWGQGKPVNMYCPLACGIPTYAGCVTLATIQVMYYWRHPAHGYGSHAYIWDGDNCGVRTLTADFSDPYDWDNMPYYVPLDAPLEQRQAVAELAYEVAVAFESTFGRNGTGALVANAANILPAYFGYNRSANRQNRTDYGSDEEWFAIFREQLDLQRPLPMGLRGYHDRNPNETIAHAVVVDGYMIQPGQEDLLHFNLGWSHRWDGWYAFNNIHTGSSHWNYQEDQHCVRDIFPDPCLTPDMPVNLSSDAEAVSGLTGYTLTWDEATAADHYQIEESIDPGFADAGSITTRTPSSIFRHDVEVITDYYYRVRAVGLCGDLDFVSQWSDVVAVTVAPGSGAASALRYLVPGIAHTSGSGGTSWRSNLSVLNLSGNPDELLIIYRHEGGSEVVAEGLASGQINEWDDVAAGLFGMTAATSGAIEVTSDVPVIVMARTYNQTQSGTYGQVLPGCEVNEALVPGATAILTQLKSTSAFRTNIGFVSFGDTPCQVVVQLYSADGTRIGNPLYRLVPGGGWTQINSVFGKAGVSPCPIGYATVEVLTPGAAIWTYASVIDANTGDPLTVPQILIDS
jgi:hypothetical protein